MAEASSVVRVASTEELLVALQLARTQHIVITQHLDLLPASFVNDGNEDTSDVDLEYAYTFYYSGMVAPPVARNGQVMSIRVRCWPADSN